MFLKSKIGTDWRTNQLIDTIPESINVIDVEHKGTCVGVYYEFAHSLSGSVCTDKVWLNTWDVMEMMGEKISKLEDEVEELTVQARPF